MSDQRNLLLAVAISVLIFLGYEYYLEQRYPEPPPGTTGQMETAGQPVATPGAVPEAPSVPTAGGAQLPTAPGTAPVSAPTTELDRGTLLKTSQRVQIRSPRLNGSIALTGGRLDDLTLADYHETLDRESPEIILLSPKGGPDPYFADFGWIGSNIKLPGPTTVWRADHDTLAPGGSVTLSWDNGEGLRFLRILSLDENFMFTVTQRVQNTGSVAVELRPYGLISRHGTPEVTGFVILHEGPLGVFDGKLQEIDYDEIADDGVIRKTSTGGWIGITDKFWLTALIPAPTTQVHSRFSHRLEDKIDKYQVEFVGGAQSVAPRGTIEVTSNLFAGAKEITLLDGYEETIGVQEFDKAIDFGVLYFLTKPIFQVLIYINNYVGNFGVAILLLTVLIKLIFFPLANKSYRAMSKMKKLQPEMIKLRERFGEDKVRLNQEMMALYKREKTNPASGCLPMLVQIPVFFALYKVLFVTIEMRHAPFYGWIKDLSAADPTSIWNLFGLIPWDPSGIVPDVINIGVWPIIMGASMFVQQKLNPQPTDPMQAKIFLYLPLLFTFLLANFPAGLVIYWAWNNILSMIQQKVIMIRMGVK